MMHLHTFRRNTHTHNTIKIEIPSVNSLSAWLLRNVNVSRGSWRYEPSVTVCRCVPLSVLVSVCVCVCVRARAHTHTHTHTHQDTQRHTSTYSHTRFIPPRSSTHIYIPKKPCTETVHRRNFNFYCIMCMGVPPECV